jgi:bacteriorhodopsin
MREVFFSGGGFTVTNGTLTTPRRAYDLSNVEMVSVRQPLFLLCGGVGVGVLGFVASFYRYLYDWEVAALSVSAVLAIIISAMVGTLKVHSLAMRSDEGTLYGRISTLRKVKSAVERAIDHRA